MATTAPTRIASMDVLRGVAVMGILAANLPGFALPHAAYFSPLAWGGSTGANLWVWFATYVLVEGKMRALFSILFGASTLIVTDAALAKGDSPAQVHFTRMATLALFGAVHLYLIWWGDILLHYALVGALAYMFIRLPVRWLLACAAAMLALQMTSNAMATLSFFAAEARDTPAKVATWNGFVAAFGVPPAAQLHAQIDTARSGFLAAAADRWQHEESPFFILILLGLQTLSAMLLGMAGYRSGFLTAQWSPARYRRWALVCLGTTLPLYALLATNTLMHGFSPPWVFFASVFAAEPLRPVTAIGYAALVILLLRPGGWLTTRVAAVGRAAFTNYLGTSLVMALIFNGWGLSQFGAWSRAQLYLLAPAVWVLMLLWSTPWLDRFRYGPFEWLWRSLARLSPQPMRAAMRAGRTPPADAVRAD